MPEKLIVGDTVSIQFANSILEVVIKNITKRGEAVFIHWQANPPNEGLDSVENLEYFKERIITENLETISLKEIRL